MSWEWRDVLQLVERVVLVVFKGSDSETREGQWNAKLYVVEEVEHNEQRLGKDDTVANWRETHDKRMFEE